MGNSWKPHLQLWLVLALMTALLAGCSRKPAPEGTAAPGAAGTISGTITLDPPLKEKVGQAPLLLIFASTTPDLSQPALIVKRESGVSFPYDYKLSAEDITLVGSSFEGRLYVTARIDPQGMVGPARPGTFDGGYPGNPVAVGSSKVDIVINQAH